MKDRTILLFGGPPGAGKGSFSQVCVRNFGFKQVSTGDLCRQEIAKSSEIGKKIDFLIKSGRLIPDDLVTQMVFDWFRGLPDDAVPIILDGYPRTVGQAERFHHILKERSLPFRVLVVELVLDDEEVVKRLHSRFICQNKECQAIYSADPASLMMPKKEGICDRCGGRVDRRKDDVPEVIRERLQVYHQHAQALFDFYKKVGYRVLAIDAQQPLKDMLRQLEEKIDGLAL